MAYIKAAALSLLLSQTLAQNTDLPQPIVGCEEVSCPSKKTDYHCTVSDTNFSGIGLARIPSVPSALTGLSLVKGVSVENGEVNNTWKDETRSFTSKFYLGTPQDFSVDDISGCAVIFETAPAKEFQASGPSSWESATGTCPDVINQACLEDLTSLARHVRYNETVPNKCDALEQGLKKNPTVNCLDMMGKGKGLGNFTVVRLDDAEPITGQKNSTSDCWPIEPKTDGLAEIGEVTALGDYGSDALIKELYKITPVLTVFLGNDSGLFDVGNLLDKTAAQFTCLKVVDNPQPDLDGEEDAGDNGAAGRMASLMGVGGSALFSALFMAW